MSEQKIVPCIWFNADADEAVAFYQSALPDCEVRNRSQYPTDGLADFQSEMAGKTLTTEFSVGGLRITALNGGSEFRPTPMLSFILNFDPATDEAAADRLESTWQR